MSKQVTVQEERANRLQWFKDQFEKQTPAFVAQLPAHVPVEKFKRVAMTALINNPSLVDCDAKSVLTACSRAAADGLLPDGREGAIVQFKATAQWMPMIAGILKKVRNSGELLSISAHCVYKKDTFRYRLGDDENIEHMPYLGDDAGEIIAVYAIAKTKDGGIYREVMTRAQVEKVRAVSRAAQNGPWVAWWDEMARKTVIRRLAKRLPMSTDREDDLRAMLERDDDEPMQDVTPPADAEPRPTREQFQGPSDDGVDGPKKDSKTPSQDGGDNVTAGKAEAATPSASDPRAGMSQEELDRVEREADRMQRGQEDDEGSAEAAIDLTAIAIPEKNGAPDGAAYIAAVNAALAKIDTMVDLVEFDAANRPIATKAGGAIIRNYGIAVMQAKARIEAAR